MSRFTLLTLDPLKEGLLKSLQKFEGVHFKNLQDDELAELDFLSVDYAGEDASLLESELVKVKFALEKIKPYVVKKSGLKAMTAEPKTMTFSEFDSFAAGYDYQDVYWKIKNADEGVKSCALEISKLEAENARLEPWRTLDVTVSQIEGLKSVRCLLGLVPNAHALREAVEGKFSSCYIEVFGSAKEGTAVLLMMHVREYDEAAALAKAMGLSPAGINGSAAPAELLASNVGRIAELRHMSEEHLQVIRSMSDENENLQIVRDYLETAIERVHARENFLHLQGQSGVVLIEGWVPKEQLVELNGIVEKSCGARCFFETEDVESDNAEVPIKLKNNKIVSAFEDITVMFSMPRYNEIDPTPVMAPFYWAFFGLMVGDTGYGLVLLIATWLVLKFCHLKESTRNFIRFFYYLSYAVIIAGFIYGSFFGFPFFTPVTGADGQPKALLDSQADIALMIVLSIVIGVIHVVFGLFVKLYTLIKERKYFDAFADGVLWIVTVLSMVMLIVSVAIGLPSIVGTISGAGLIIGIIGLILTQGREYPTPIGKFGGGIYGAYGLANYVGDFVSYTRIAALMLSGAYIAFSFNEIAAILRNGVVGTIVSVLIIILGGTLNLALSLLSAYVHTCRLQYVEYFGKFFEGGGKQYKPFSLKNTFINIKKDNNF